MALAIDILTESNNGLLYFERYEDIFTWLEENRKEINAKNGDVNLMTLTIMFPNGNKLILGYGDRARYLGIKFLFDMNYAATSR